MGAQRAEALCRGSGPRVWEMQERVPENLLLPFCRLLTFCLTGGRRASDVDSTHFKSRRLQVKDGRKEGHHV